MPRQPKKTASVDLSTSSIDELAGFLGAAAQVINKPFGDLPILVGTTPGGATFASNVLAGYQVQGRLKASPDTGLSLRGLTITATGNTPIRSETLREVKLGQLLSIVQAQLGWALDGDEARRHLGLPRISSEMRTAGKAAKVVRKPLGRAPLGDDHYRLVATALLEELERGPARGVHERLAKRLTEELGRAVNRDTARDWVRIARSKQWLAPTTQGQPGAFPGSRLIADGYPQPNTIGKAQK